MQLLRSLHLSQSFKYSNTFYITYVHFERDHTKQIDFPLT